MNSGHVIFSPIAHTHPIAKSCNLPASWDYWERYDTRIIERCDELWVLMLFGWQESRGVSAEIGIARRLGKPVKCVRRQNGEAITGLWQGGDAVIVDLVEELGLDGEAATVRFK